MEEIQDLSKRTDFNNLTYRYNGNTAAKSFYRFKSSTRFLWKFKGRLYNTRKSRRRTKRIDLNQK